MTLRAWMMWLLLAAAAAAAFDQPAPYLTGRVIDGDTGEAVAGASIHLQGRRSITLTTGADGRYQSGTLLSGMYTITVTRDGYLPAVALYAGRVPLRLRIREDGIGPAIVQKDWMLERAARIRGRIVSDGGTPVEGVTVIAARRVRNVDGWPEFDARSSATSGADGLFQIGNLARGAYVLAYQMPIGGQPRWFYSPGIMDPRHAGHVEAVTSTPDVIELRGSGAPFPALPVSTLSPGGGPAAGTLVELDVWNPFAATSRVETVSTVTDSSGRGQLANVPVGRHVIRARTPSALSSPATARTAAVAEVPARESRGVALRMQHAIHACVFTRWETDGVQQADLQSLPSISVSTRDALPVMESVDERATLGEMIALKGLLPGSMLRVAANAPDLWTLTRFAPPKTAPRGVVPLDAAAAGCTAAYFRRTSTFIRGRVQLGDLEWVPDVAIIATPLDSPSAPVVVSAMTDDGMFHLSGIAVGLAYEVLAIPAGFTPDGIAKDLRHPVTAAGGDIITIPLSLPIAR